MKNKSLILAIDFDGTVVTHEFPNIGKDVGAVPILKRIVESGHRIILNTMRSDIENPKSDDKGIHPVGGNYLTDAVNWFKENDIPVWGINENPEQYTWTHSPKPYAHIYIDDAALGCPLIYPPNGRPYVDWRGIEALLISKGII